MDNKDIINYCHPNKWLRILDKLGDDANKLRLNLAHFGGEDDVTALFDWPYQDVNAFGQKSKVWPRPGIRQGTSWTYPIMIMLKKYPHVYSDLGAFDFDDAQAAVSLLWLLARDIDNDLEIEGIHKLRDKLLWGSDVPMTLFDVKSYADQFNKFYRRTNPATSSSSLEIPEINKTGFSDHQDLVETLIDTNPGKFLFGS
jgi:hypothetical protein